MKKLLALLLALALMLPCIALGETLVSDDGVCIVTLPDGYYLDDDCAMAPDGMGNLNIQNATLGISMEALALVKDTFDDVFTKQYIDMLNITEDDITTYDIKTIGDHQWYRIDVAMSLMGIDIVVNQYVTVVGKSNDAYILTFTGISDEEVLYMIENVVFTK